MCDCDFRQNYEIKSSTRIYINKISLRKFVGRCPHVADKTRGENRYLIKLRTILFVYELGLCTNLRHVICIQHHVNMCKTDAERTFYGSLRAIRNLASLSWNIRARIEKNTVRARYNFQIKRLASIFREKGRRKCDLMFEQAMDINGNIRASGFYSVRDGEN